MLNCRHGFGAKMACRVCNSENLQKLEGELTASLPGLKDLKVSPIYVCQNVLVCLDCGFAELVIPTTKLLPLKSAKAAPGF
jgi:hypothetical protein